MKKKFAGKKTMILVAIIAAVAVLIVWSYKSFKNTIPDSSDTITLSEGRQTHFDNLFIGLSSVDKKSAWISIHKDGDEESTQKQLSAGESVEIDGYIIEIKSVNDSWIPSLTPGSSGSKIKFTIKKQ